MSSFIEQLSKGMLASQVNSFIPKKSFLEHLTDGILKGKHSSFTMHDSLLKMLSAQRAFESNLSTISLPKALLLASQSYSRQSFATSFAAQSKALIPSAIFDIVSGIGKQQDACFGIYRDASQLWRQKGMAIGHINSLHSALTAISTNVIANAARERKWELIENFNTFNEQVIGIADNVVIDSNLSDEHALQLQQIVDEIISFYRKNKKYARYLAKFITVILALMAVHQYADFIKQKPATVTQVDLRVAENRILKAIETKAAQEREYRTINRRCQIRIWPDGKVVTNLPANFNVIVLSTCHKWVFISFSNPETGLTSTGWMLKKYLNRALRVNTSYRHFQAGDVITGNVQPDDMNSSVVVNP